MSRQAVVATEYASPLESELRVSRLTWAGLAAGVAIVLGVGIWGISAPRGEEQDPDLALLGQGLRVAGGIVRVDQARDTSVRHVMQGMDFADQQGPGMVRYAVTVALSATGTKDIAVDPAAFLIEGEGVSGLAPFGDDLGADVVPAGTRLSFTLVYQIPEAAERLVLVVPGAEERVALTPGGATRAGSQHPH